MINNYPGLLLKIICFIDSSMVENKNIAHLITFSKTASLNEHIEGKQIIDSLIRRAIDDELKLQNEETFPHFGLFEVFSLIEEHFPRGKGVLLLISDGEYTSKDSVKADSGLKKIVKAISNIGFTLFPIFICGNSDLASITRMRNIAAWAGTDLCILDEHVENKTLLSLYNNILATEITSPIPRRDYLKDIDSIPIPPRDYLGEIAKIVIAIIFVSFILYLLYRFFRKIITNNNFHLPYLWGKLIDQNGNPIFLMHERPPFIIRPPDELPVFQLSSHKNAIGKKVIRVHLMEDGYIDYGGDYSEIINEQTNYFEIKKSKTPSNPSNKAFKYYFNFTNCLSEKIGLPVWEDEDFGGRNSEIELIVNNFLEEHPKNILINNIIRAGKSSIMFRLYKIIFPANKILKSIYNIIFIEYNKDIYNLSDFDECRDKFNIINSNKAPKNIIFIDDYDKIFEKFGKIFSNFLTEYLSVSNNHLVLAGQKPLNLINFFHNDVFYHSFMSVRLIGLNMNSQSENTVLIEWIRQIFEKIGFNKCYYTPMVINSIIDYASGYPMLILQIINGLLNLWINSPTTDTLQIRHVQEAFDHGRFSILGDTLQRAIDYDEKDCKSAINVSQGKILIRDILNKLSLEFQGRAIYNDLLTSILTKENDDRKDAQIKSFKEQIKILKDLQILRQNDEILEANPNGFFMQRKRIV